MTDLTTLSDAQLLELARSRNQAASPPAPAAPSLADMSDEQLLRLAARRDMTQAGALAQGLSSGAALNLNDEIAGLRAAGLAGLPAIAERTVARSPVASAIAANVGGARMIAERALPSLFGSRATEAYAPARDVERARDKAAEEMFPATYTGSNIAGSVAVPAGMIGRGLKAATAAGAGTGLLSGFGRGEGLEDRAQGAAIEGGIGAVAPAAFTGLLRAGGSGVGRAALGATAGGALGATQGGSLEERATNAAIGAGIGAVTPAALLMAGRPIVNTIQGTFAPGTVAERTVRQAIEADRARSGRLMLSPEDIEAARLSGQEIVVGDIGGTGTARLARAAANASQDADAVLRDVVTPRYEEQRKRFGDFINDLFGGNLNMTAVRDTLEQTARRVNAPLYRAAERAGENADLWNPVFERLAQSPSVQAAIRNAETRAADRAAAEGDIVIRNPFSFDDQGRMTWATTADGGRIQPNLQFWDQVQRNLREASEAAPPGSTRQKDLEALRRRLNQELDSAVPEFAQARGTARQFFGAQDASEAGQLFFRQRQAMQLTDAQKAFRSMSEPERELFRRGFASELAHTLQTPTAGRDVVKMFDGIDRRKLELVFPPDELRQLEGFARREQIMNRLYTQVIGGSSTVRQARDLGLGVAGGGAAGAFAAGDPVTGLAMGGTLGALAVNLLSRGRSRISENVMREVGEILSSNDPARINALLGGPNGPEIVGALRTLSTATNSMARPPRREPTIGLPPPSPPGPPGPSGFAKGGRVKEPKMSPIVEAIIEEMGKRMAPEGARRAAAAAGYSRGGAVRRVAQALAERIAPEAPEAPARGGLAAARPGLSGISPPGMASAEDISRAARTSGDLTYKQLGELYGDLGLTGGGASPLVERGLMSQSDEAIEAATRLKLADRDTIAQAIDRYGKTFTTESGKGKSKTMPTTEALFAGKIPGMRLPSQELADSSGKTAEGARIAREVKRAEGSFESEVGRRGVLFDLSPDTLNRMPDVPQFDLPRAAPKVTARLEGLEREGPARLRRYVEAGGEEGQGWYNLQQLRNDFRAAYGPVEGDERFRLWTLVNASTSMTNPIESNIRTASHYLNRALRGEPLPQVVQVSDPKTGKTVQTLAGDLPPPYGAKAQVQHAQRTREFLSGEMDPVFNPKPVSYQQNLLGNWRPITSDTHYIRDIVGPSRFDAFGENSALLPGEYALLEQMGQKVAKGRKIAPAQAQSAAWVGGGKDTGLKSEPIPYLEALQKRIGITARIRGEPMDVTYQKFLRGEIDLYAEGGKVKKPKKKGGLAAARRAKAA